MPSFFEYIGNITYYLLFAAVVGIFAPVGKYRKFVSLVLGLVLLVLMVQPLVGIFGGNDIPVTQWFAGAVPTMENSGASGNYEAWWDEHLRGSFEAQLEQQVARLLNGAGFEVHSAAFDYSSCFGEITGVRVRVSRAEVSQSGEDGRVPLIRIKPPEIRPIRIGETAEICPHTETVKNLISQFYNLPTSHIYVEVR
ncbi:MAG: stage III sporulation protein AF [Defluviitaleaceae bacterium]|nr:stage III sporulation protein AF [Defluviitaleaceae bacterium]MCL2264171.1 stage III sporulation protein AF [Defluviitaleaceae bacterium]